jgi:hypothetical protein
MNGNPKARKFKKMEKVYFRVTLSILVLSSTLLVIGYMLVQAVQPSPQVVVYLATLIFYYHFAHFIMGLSFFTYYMTKIRNKVGKFKILRTFFSILLTPISFIIMYTAVFLLAISSCAGS